MPKATPARADSTGPQPLDPIDTTSSHAGTPAWFNLHAIVPRELCDEVAALTNEAEFLEAEVRDFAVRCFRALTQVEAAELEADNTRRVGDAALMLAEEYSGVRRLAAIVDSMINHLDVARIERPSSVPGWVSTEVDAMDSWLAAFLLPWLDDMSPEAPAGDAS